MTKHLNLTPATLHDDGRVETPAWQEDQDGRPCCDLTEEQDAAFAAGVERVGRLPDDAGTPFDIILRASDGACYAAVLVKGWYWHTPDGWKPAKELGA